jgi:hypothetical protein
MRRFKLDVEDLACISGTTIGSVIGFNYGNNFIKKDYSETKEKRFLLFPVATTIFGGSVGCVVGGYGYIISRIIPYHYLIIPSTAIGIASYVYQEYYNRESQTNKKIDDKIY